MTQQNPTQSNASSPGRQPGGEPSELPNTLEDLAVTALKQILITEAAPPALRLRAAQAVLRNTTRPAGRSTAYTRSIVEFDQLCLDLAPHQALTRLGA